MNLKLWELIIKSETHTWTCLQRKSIRFMRQWSPSLTFYRTTLTVSRWKMVRICQIVFFFLSFSFFWLNLNFHFDFRRHFSSRQCKMPSWKRKIWQCKYKASGIILLGLGRNFMQKAPTAWKIRNWHSYWIILKLHSNEDPKAKKKTFRLAYDEQVTFQLKMERR